MSAKAFLALLLEDEPLIAMDMELLLQGAGLDVTTVASCEEANNWLEVRRPDIVIVDIMLRDG
ncbi:MAG: response regulator [Alphaproteobacteria bacterium]|nr:response regulator [Alphaproteobacteria bacterium]MBU1561716.1 response regulator [Alphaproteobacteria bacterium]MBU2303010.1 response regulator [Alphaproteobacteria bacterium]MBU2368796.1 response regulator [Alphaproteobacteria bacterium]